MSDQTIVRALYRKLVALYPREFREQLGESMQQTFRDLWTEKQKSKKELLGFIVWTFIDTIIGIFTEHLLILSPGVIMQTILQAVAPPALISVLLVFPFMIMEVVNRQNFNEEFPFMLFFVLWLNLFAINLILLPIMRSRPTAKHNVMDPLPAQGNHLLTNPKSAATISVALILSLGILPLLNSVGWLSLDRLFNGPNPEVAYLPGMFMSLALISIPIAAGVIAARPIVHTLRSGGRLFAHPVNLIIVFIISFLFAAGLVGLIVDQWPCFMGVPNCD